MGSIAGMAVIAALAAAAAVTAAAAVGTIWWAIFGDKARGRRRCPRCWHDLSRTPGLTCSECGHAARGEAELGKARRRWGVAAATLVAVAAAAVWTQSIILNQGWASYVPDVLLVRLPWLLPAGSRPRDLLEELADRLDDGALSVDEVLTLAQSVAEAAPAAGSFDDPMAGLLEAIDRTEPEELDPMPGEPGSVTSDKDARRRAFEAARRSLLDRLQAWIQAVPLERVPAGGPGLVAVRGTVWGTPAEWRVREAGSGDRWLAGDADSGMRRTPSGSVLRCRTAPTEGRLRCELETAVRRRTADGTAWAPWTEGPRVTVDGPSMAVDLAGLEPVDDAGTRAAAVACFDKPVVAWESDEIPMALRFHMTTFAANGFGDLLVGIRAEVLEDGIPRRRSRLWWSGSSRSGWAIEHQDTAALRRLRDAIRDAASRTPTTADPSVIPGWTIRITSETDTAARALPPGTAPNPRDRVWAGSLEIPVRGLLEPANQARRAFWFDPIESADRADAGPDGDLPDKNHEIAPKR